MGSKGAFWCVESRFEVLNDIASAGCARILTFEHRGRSHLYPTFSFNTSEMIKVLQSTNDALYTTVNHCAKLSVISILIAVPCREGDIRLAVSGYSGTGRLEVCVNSTWGTICSNSWESTAASVSCRELGHSPYGRVHTVM